MEIVGGKWKTFVGIGVNFSWALSYCILPGIAYAESNWRHLQLVISLPQVMLLFIYYFVPESPRWLIQQGRVEEALIILRRAAKTNGKNWPEHTTFSFNEEKRANIFDLFKSSNLRRNTLIQYFNWFSASFVYFALTFDSGTLMPGNIYINATLSGLIEFPAYTLCMFCLHRFGRKGPVIFFYYLLGGSLLISLAMPNDEGILAMATIGKFGVICAFAIIYVQAVELFPTVLRSTGIGSASSMARIGSVIAPIVGRELAKYHRTLTIVMFSMVALVSGSLTFLLPETNGKSLPDTLEQSEAFVVGGKKRQEEIALENN